MNRIAFCTVPHYGGIFSSYQRLRENLISHGIEVRCVHVGDEHRLWYGYDPSLKDEGCVHIVPGEHDLRRCARAFVDWLGKNDIDIVLPMSSRVCLSAVPYYPAHVKIITRCVGITPFTYRLASVWSEYVSGIVYTSLRQKRDLVRFHHVPESKLFHIPNAVDINTFRPVRKRPEGRRFSIGFVDRIDNREKNVCQIEQVLKRLDRQLDGYRLHIVGSGPDEAGLRSRLAKWTEEGKAVFEGAFSLSEMPDIYKKFDVLLKLSPAEGFPSTIIEAMASGVVPVCYRISGVTDWIVTDGKEGFVCEINAIDKIVNRIIALYNDKELLKYMSDNACARVSQDFNTELFCERWARLFGNVLTMPETGKKKTCWSDFELCHLWRPGAFRRHVVRRIPLRFRRFARILQEKYIFSSQ